jgi:HNH endonuclease/Helix-turn-helix domain
VADAESFWVQVQKSPACWLWVGSIRADGRARVFVRGRGLVRAHRFAWELTYGPIPKGFQVQRTCRNDRCVRPDHLALATPAGVARQREKRRTSPARSKLSDVEVRQIREAHAAGTSQTTLARRFQVSPGTINAIVHRRTWRDLT